MCVCCMMARVFFIIIVIKKEDEAKYFNYTSPPIRACKVPTVWSHDEITNVLLPCRRTPDITAAAQVIGLVVVVVCNFWPSSNGVVNRRLYLILFKTAFSQICCIVHCLHPRTLVHVFFFTVKCFHFIWIKRNLFGWTLCTRHKLTSYYYYTYIYCDGTWEWQTEHNAYHCYYNHWYNDEKKNFACHLVSSPFSLSLSLSLSRLGNIFRACWACVCRVNERALGHVPGRHHRARSRVQKTQNIKKIRGGELNSQKS